MTCLSDLLEKLDNSAENYEFPFWQCGEENAFVAKMRTSGFKAEAGVALIFEKFEYFISDSFIQSVATCISTFPIPIWVNIGESIKVNLRYSNADKFPVEFGVLKVKSRGHEFSIPLEKDDLRAKEYLQSDAIELTPEAVLLKIEEVVPRDFLFSEPEYLKRVFNMDEKTQRIFVVEEWQHPLFDEIYNDGINPSEAPDIKAMAEALCQGSSTPQLVGKPNTSWQAQCKNLKKPA